MEVGQFRVKYYDDERTLESKWVLFSNRSRGSVGKIIFKMDNGQKAAYIKAVEVHPSIRGLGLSTILFHACFQTLCNANIALVRLEAKEDYSRYNRLVRFYQNWNFQVQPNTAQVYHAANNDTFRKISMCLELSSQTYISVFPNVWFQMVSFSINNNQTYYVNTTHTGNLSIQPKHTQFSTWQTFQLDQGSSIGLRSFYGKYLCAESDGQVVANRNNQSTWESFQVIPNSTGVSIRTFHGLYLGVQEEKIMSMTTPYTWQIAPNGFTTTTTSMRETYSTFTHGSYTIQQSCELLDTKTIQRMLSIAQEIQKDGHPDWFQLIGFLYGFGTLLFRWMKDKPQTMHDYGPDQYLYDVLVHSKNSLPHEALEMIRLKSCTSWYQDDSSPEDEDLKQLVRLFAGYIDSEPQIQCPSTVSLDSILQLSDKYLDQTIEW